METSRSRLGRNVMALLVAFGLGVLFANPSAFVWRVRYWIPVGDRGAALDRLVRAEPTGADSELSIALESDDRVLRFVAAGHLAARGDRRGLEAIVELCDANHPGARQRLESLLLDPSTLERYASAREWYAAARYGIRFEHSSRWSGAPVN
jgi:hypothetical protein